MFAQFADILHKGIEAPKRCPACISPSTQFMLMEDPEQEKVKAVEKASKEKEYSCLGEACSTEQEQGKEQEAAVDTVEKEKTDETVKRSNILDNALFSKEDEIEILKYRTAKLQAMNWYKEKHNCSMKVAKDVVDLVFEKDTKHSSANNDCFITILVVIVSTFSVFFCL